MNVDVVASAIEPEAILPRGDTPRAFTTKGGRWVVWHADDVERLLRTEAAVIGFTPSPGDPAQEIQGRMARFSDGPEHERRRAIAVTALDALDAARLGRRAAHLTRDAIAGESRIDVMALAARIPLVALAEALDLPQGEEALAAIESLCRRLAPSLDDAVRPDPTTVAAALATAFGPLDERTVNVASLLFQARDATAGLIGIAAYRLLGEPDRTGPITAETIERIDRAEPAVQLTTRTTTRDMSFGDVVVPAGGTIVVWLAAANRQIAAAGSREGAGLEGAGPEGAGSVDDCSKGHHDRAARSFSFGAGAHACPGRSLALEIAAGVLRAVMERGARMVGGVVYEPRPNLRIPTELVVELAPAGHPGRAAIVTGDRTAPDEGDAT
jgi:cytochrome P450